MTATASTRAARACLSPTSTFCQRSALHYMCTLISHTRTRPRAAHYLLSSHFLLSPRFLHAPLYAPLALICSPLHRCTRASSAARSRFFFRAAAFIVYRSRQRQGMDGRRTGRGGGDGLNLSLVLGPDRRRQRWDR